MIDVEKISRKKLIDLNIVHTAKAHRIIEEFKRILFHEALIACGGNSTQASEICGVSRNTLMRVIGTTIAKWRFKNGVSLKNDAKVVGAQSAVNNLKRDLVLERLPRANGNITQVAKELGIDRETANLWIGIYMRESTYQTKKRRDALHSR